MLSILFEQYDIETFTAASVSEALEILKQTKINLLISEVLLPNEDGYSLMRQVKAFEMQRQVQIPASALTVCARECDRDRAISVGFNYYLSKPFDIDELIAAVAYLTLTKQVQALSA